MRRIEDRVVLVTGGTRGLGRACALRLADEGADLVVAGRDLESGCHVADEVRARGRRALPLALDVTDPVRSTGPCPSCSKPSDVLTRRSTTPA